MDFLNVRDDIETNSGVKIPVSRSDMSFKSESEYNCGPEWYEINFFQIFEGRHRAQIDAEHGHRRVTGPRLRVNVKETRGILTGYLRAPSDLVKYDRESRKVSTQHTNEP